MLMKKRGFTLMEVLAVIVVLAVISFIAVPITLNLIEESRQNSFRNSTNGMIKSIEMYYVENAGTSESLDLGNKNTIETLDFTGKAPISGYAYITSDGIISILMYNDKYVSYRKYGEETVTVLNIKECVSNSSCPTSGSDESVKITFLNIPTTEIE